MKKKTIDANGFEVHIRHCLFCNDGLPANIHELRKFCPTKFGIANYCKYKYKELVQQQRLTGKEPVLTHRDEPEKLPPEIALIPIVNEDPFVPAEPIIETTTQINARENNVKIIQSFLKEGIEAEVNVDMFFDAGYDVTVFDAKLPALDSGLYYLEIDQYALFWYTEEKILLTYINQTLWLTE